MSVSNNDFSIGNFSELLTLSKSDKEKICIDPYDSFIYVSDNTLSDNALFDFSGTSNYVFAERTLPILQRQRFPGSPTF